MNIVCNNIKNTDSKDTIVKSLSDLKNEVYSTLFKDIPSSNPTTQIFHVTMRLDRHTSIAPYQLWSFSDDSSSE